MKFHPVFHAFIRSLYYSRITVTGAEKVPADEPLLVLGLHRNGAVDGFVYRAAVPRLNYLVRAKLRNNPLGKLFFSGVEVVRSDDGGRGEDTLAMVDGCVSEIRSGTRLAVFPEGTSKLGPRHLPFKSGAARIALSCLENDVPVTVLPLGIHYECPWAFRSRVEIVVGEPIQLPSPAPTESRGARLRGIKETFTTALEDVGINVADEETQELTQKFAYIATLGTRHRYFDALKAMEKGLPPDAVSAWKSLEDTMQGKRVLRHQGVPLFPIRMPLAYALLTVLLAIPVISGALINFPPLVIAWLVARRCADDTNVIALWRILAGVPLLVLWAVVWIITAAVLGQAWVALSYLSLTWIAVLGWYRLKKLAVFAWNGLFHSGLREGALAIRDLILRQPAFSEPNPITPHI
jgi:1-acyl-sn-glycerol-3-phosphate acyltransferase